MRFSSLLFSVKETEGLGQLPSFVVSAVLCTILCFFFFCLTSVVLWSHCDMCPYRSFTRAGVKYVPVALLSGTTAADNYSNIQR